MRGEQLYENRDIGYTEVYKALPIKPIYLHGA